MEWHIDPEAAQDNLWQQLNTTIPQSEDDARRLFHGRGHCFDGMTFLNVDWFSPVLLLTLFQDPGKEWLNALVQRITNDAAWQAVTCIVAQQRFQKGAPSDVLWGTLPTECVAREDGLTYEIALGQQQNIGFFLDMRNGREWLKEHAAGKRILNLFSFTCAFSVVALAHGASSVTNLDMSRTALATGKRNHERNDLDVRNAHFWGYDLFRSWGRLRKFGPFDLVICDPPSFQRGSFVARKDYARMVKRFHEITSPQQTTEILACLNAPKLDFAFLRQVFADHAPGFLETAVIPTPEEFPEQDPDKGLKTIIFTRPEQQQ